MNNGLASGSGGTYPPNDFLGQGGFQQPPPPPQQNYLNGYGGSQWGGNAAPNMHGHSSQMGPPIHEQQAFNNNVGWQNGLTPGQSNGGMQHNHNMGMMGGGGGAMNTYGLPQQFYQDAMNLSKPVETTDEPTLNRALLAARQRGITYKEALNSLHGVRICFISL